jgi:hypothetical protein
MNNQSVNMKYPEHYKYRAPQINLPYKKTDLSIFKFYSMRDVEYLPVKIASCNVCEKEFEVIPGSYVHSSYTATLKFHLQLHEEQWLDYLDCLKVKMVPDTKNQFEHFQSMEKQVFLPEFLADKKSQEIREHRYFVKNNLAGKPYMERDHFYLINRKSNLFSSAIDGENCQILECIYKYTNRNVSLVELLGDNHPSANLQKKYKRYKCLTENIGNIVLDLERFLCENMCFFDPINYDQCPNEHKGDIAIFSDIKYQQSVPTLIEELDKYPEFIVDKTFNHNLLKEVKRVENNSHALFEMNRFLKIILSLIHIKKEIINEKIGKVVRDGTGEDNLIKPNLVLQRWGPKYHNPDEDKDVLKSLDFEESMFSTYQHVNDQDCPGFGAAKKVYTVPFDGDHGKVYYPCNVGGCAKGCECEVCNMWAGDEIINCPDHHPDHPKMFNPREDIVIQRRIYFEPTHKWPRFERPLPLSKRRPSILKLADMKQKCNICRKVVKDHLENHHSVKLHKEFCEICAHLQLLSDNSFALTCYICMKKFENKYRLQDHLDIHNPENQYNCLECDKKFTTSFTHERHLLEKHTEVKLFECDLCEQKFNLERNLQRHLKNIHEIGVSPFKCDLCPTFKRNDNLLKHERDIHNINKHRLFIKGVNDTNGGFECCHCEKIFKSKDQLKRHMDTVHSQEVDRYICEICKKGFNRKDTLKKHQKIHK